MSAIGLNERISRWRNAMSETKWSPGPWQIGEDGEVIDADGNFVAEVLIPWNGTEAERAMARADLRLIATSLELNKALEALLNEVIEAGFDTVHDQGWPTIIQQARAALAKARDEP
jgi:hypothetical protein